MLVHNDIDLEIQKINYPWEAKLKRGNKIM